MVYFISNYAVLRSIAIGGISLLRMEDGSSMPLWGALILFLLLCLNGIFYGFAAAVQNISGNEVEKRALDGDRKSVV